MNAHNILQIVERQCRLWGLQQETQCIEAEDSFPVITVSRQFGARGEALARLIGERIGFTVWDAELVHTVAEETGASEAILKSLDEHHRKMIEDAIEGALMGGKYMHSEYLRRLMKLIHTIHSHGNSVIVGRGAQYILDPATILRGAGRIIRADSARRVRRGRAVVRPSEARRDARAARRGGVRRKCRSGAVEDRR